MIQEDTLRISKEFDYLTIAMAAIARKETPKEFFNRIDWVMIKNNLDDTLAPINLCMSTET